MTRIDSIDHDDPFLLELEPFDSQTARDALIETCTFAADDERGAKPAWRLANLVAYDRFARFEQAVAEILGVSSEYAAGALSRIDDASAWQEQAPGIAFISVEAAPEKGFVYSGLLRVHAGHELPRHEHLGDELTLVLQGAFVEDSQGRRFGPGEPSHMLAGSSHAFVVPAVGPHLIGLVTLRTGIRPV